MELRLTRGEYWLLETVVSAGCPLCFVAVECYPKPEGMESMFNKPGHGLNRSQVVDTLDRLFKEGLIEARQNDRLRALTKEEIAAELIEIPPPRDRRTLTSYWLTAKGGAVWEEFAAPSWDCFLDTRLDHETKTGVVTCMTSWLARKYLRYMNVAFFEVEPESVDVKVVASWEATYWKTLPTGYQTSFRYLGERRETIHDELGWLAFSGFCKFRDGWYRWR